MRLEISDRRYTKYLTISDRISISLKVPQVSIANLLNITHSRRQSGL